MAEQNEPKKVIIDEDWKSQARKEKEKLEEKSEQTQEEEPRPEMPPVSFEGLVSFFATQAYFAMGLIRSKEDKDKQFEPDLEAARYHIDMLGLLEQKCKGNLTPEEQKLLQDVLSQLRMFFVSLSKQG